MESFFTELLELIEETSGAQSDAISKENKSSKSKKEKGSTSSSESISKKVQKVRESLMPSLETIFTDYFSKLSKSACEEVGTIVPQELQARLSEKLSELQ